MNVRWVTTDYTGRVLAALPGLVPSGSLRRTMGRYEQGTFTLTVDATTDPQWELGTREGLAALIGYVGDPGSERVVWGGMVLQRTRDFGNTVTLSAATPEAYLDRRYTGTYMVTGRDQNQIMADLVGIAASPAPGVPGLPGWPFLVQVVGPPGVARDRGYKDADDKTLFSAMDELATVDGGPQWMTSWVWQHNPERIVPVVILGGHVGTVGMSGGSAPIAWGPSQMQSGTIQSSWAAGAGGNSVTATSTSNVAATRPQSPPQSTGNEGRPVWEDRFSPSTSISTPSVLVAHATSRLALIRTGTQSLSFVVADGPAGRFLGVDWDLGDDADVTLNGPLFAGDVTVRGQVEGYDFTADTVTPYVSGAL